MKFEKAKELFDWYNTGWNNHHIYEHGTKVMKEVTKVCEELGVERSDRIIIELAARFHDIGKIRYPSKFHIPYRKFTKKDIMVLKKHVKEGYEILKGFYGDDSIATLVLYHHEKINGSGYLKGLKGEEIPLGSKIITVCDSYDAMFRHYCKRSKEEAIQELKDFKGIHFDEDVVDAFLKILRAKK